MNVTALSLQPPTAVKQRSIRDVMARSLCSEANKIDCLLIGKVIAYAFILSVTTGILTLTRRYNVRWPDTHPYPFTATTLKHVRK
jgi:hypothetical protein